MSFSIAQDILPAGATVSALGRTSLVLDDGSFEIFGVPANIGNFRIRMIAPDGTTAQSRVLTPVVDGVTFVPFLTFGPFTIIPMSLTISAPANTLSTVGQTMQLTVIGTDASGTQQNLTTDPFTYYITSNPTIATVSQSGLVTVKSIPPDLSMLIITAINEGVVSTYTFNFMVAPPVVAITSPSEGAEYVPGRTISLHASVSSVANISKVDFTVDGVVANTQTVAPYGVSLTFSGGEHTLGAHVYDIAGQRGDAVPVHIVSDPLTTITGIVVDATGNVVAGAIIHAGSMTATTDSSGHFTLSGVPTIPSAITIVGIYTDGSGKIIIGSTNINLVRGGTTSIGTLTLTVQGAWPKIHANAKNTGQGIGSGAINAVRWSYGTGSSIYSSPAIGSDGTIYVGSYDGNLYAIDGQAGALKWKYKTNGSIAYSSPAIGPDGTVYIGSEDRNLYALNGQTGVLKWKSETNGYIDSSPAIGADGTVYVGADDANLYALDGQTGTLKWKYKTNGYIESSPAIGADGTVYIGSEDNNLYALDGQAGTLKWKYKTNGSIVYSSPAIGADGTVYVGSDDSLYAIDGQTGTLNWAYSTGNYHYITSSPAIGADGTIYVGSYDSNLYAIGRQALPPLCTLLSPTQGTTFVVGQVLYVNAIATGNGIAHIDLLANGSKIGSLTASGTASWAPYFGIFTLSAGTYSLLAAAYDSTGLRGDSVPVTITVTADPLTTLTGRLVDSNGTPLSGATASALGQAITTGNDGRFTFANVPTAPISLIVWGRYQPPSGVPLLGSSASVALVHGGLTEVGDIVLRAQGAWSKFHADAQNTGQGIGSGAAGELKWKFRTSGSVTSSPAIGADGTVYVGSSDHSLYAINGQTGTLKWRYTTEGLISSSPAIGADGTVYIGSYDSNLYAINGQTGKLKWKFRIGYYISSSPAIGADGTVYVGALNNILYVLDGQTGALKWKFSGVVYLIFYITSSSPSIGADGTVYVGSVSGTLYAINGQKGALKWEYTAGNSISSSPAIGADGTVYVGSEDRNLYALNGQTGALNWAYTTGNYIKSSPAIGADGTVYVGSDDTNLYALNGQTGVLNWAYTTGSYISSSPAIGADGVVYVGSYDGNLYAIDGQTGALKWKFLTIDSITSSPAIGADGTIYIGSHDGSVYAIK